MRLFCFGYSQYKKAPLWGTRRCRVAHFCVDRGSWVSSTGMPVSAVPAAISMCSKIRGAHHCLVPRNRTSVKDVQKITLWDLWSLIFTSRHSDTLQEDAWLLRRNYSSELRCRENSCKLLLRGFLGFFLTVVDSLFLIKRWYKGDSS